jgi:hypothetical protein
MQKRDFSAITNISRLFTEVLVRYQSLSSWEGKELEFVDRENNPHFVKVGMICRSV